MNKKLFLITAIGISAGIGAGLMYIFDPERGRSRRALARNTITKTGEIISRTPQQIRNRVSEVLTEASTSYSKVKNEILAARVFTKIKEVVSNPKSIQMTINNGHLILSGTIPSLEVDALLNSVSAIRGIKGVENRLETHTRASDLLESPLLAKSVAK